MLECSRRSVDDAGVLVRSSYGGGAGPRRCLRGRREAGQDNQAVKELATEFRRRFVAEFGSSNCQVILDRLCGREDGFDCKKLTAVAAGLLSEVLTESEP